MINLPARFKFFGDADKAKTLIGRANSQLNILLMEKSLRKLNQLGRKVIFIDGTVIQCHSCYGINTVNIYCPEVEQEIIAETTTKKFYLLLTIVYGASEDAIVYEITSGSIGDNFIVEETVSCSDGGSGEISAITENKLYGNFNLCREGIFTGLTSNCTALIEECYREVFSRKYNFYDIFSSGLVKESLSDKFPYYSNVSAYDVSPLSDRLCEDISQIPINTWSKTYKDLIVVAYTFYQQSIPGIFWSLSVSFKDEQITWSAPIELRQVTTNASGTEFTDTFIGFDLWSEIDENNVEIYYFASMAERSATLNVYKINQSDPVNITIDLIETKKSNVLVEKYSAYSNPERHVRLLGFGRTAQDIYKAYWCWLGSENSYYEENLLTGTITQNTVVSSGTIISAVWNHFERDLLFVYEEDANATTTDTITNGSELDLTKKFYQYGTLISEGYYTFGYFTYHLAYFCKTVDYTPPGFSSDITLWHGKRQDFGGPGFDVWSGAYTKAWEYDDAATEQNNFVVDTDQYNKGIITERSGGYYEIETAEYRGLCAADENDYVNAEIWFPEEYDIYTNVVEYELTGIVLSPNGEISYSYNSRKSDSEGNWQAWKSYEKGLLSDFIDPEFPYDHTWHAMLLKGNTVESHYASDEVTEITSWIGYKNKTTNTCSVLNDTDNILVDNISAERLFFKQQQIDISEDFE